MSSKSIPKASQKSPKTPKANPRAPKVNPKVFHVAAGILTFAFGRAKLAKRARRMSSQKLVSVRKHGAGASWSLPESGVA